MRKNLRIAAVLSLALTAGGFLGHAAQADPISSTISRDSTGAPGGSLVRAAQDDVVYSTGAVQRKIDSARYVAQDAWDSCGACQGLGGSKPPPLPAPPAPVVPSSIEKLDAVAWDSCGACQGLGGSKPPPLPAPPAPVVPAPVQKIISSIGRP